MKIISTNISLSYVLARWWESERYKFRATSISINPLPAEGTAAWAQMAIGFHRAPIIASIPDDTNWSRVELSLEDVLQLRLIFSPDWVHLCSGSGTIAEFLEQGHEINAENIAADGSAILFGTSRGPYTILDGNHRLLAAAASKNINKNLEIYLGICDEPCRWHRPYSFKEEPMRQVHRTVNRRHSPVKFAAFTADDGYSDVVINLPDVLDRYQAQATFYLHCDRVQTSSRSASPLMGKEIFQFLRDRAQEIGGHSYHHVSWPTLTHEERLRSLGMMFCSLAEWGVIPRTFAYPFGHVNQQTIDLVGSFFETAVLADGRQQFDRDFPHLIPRIPISSGWELGNLQQILARTEQSCPIPFAVFMIHDLEGKDIFRLGELMETMLSDGWYIGSVTDCWNRISGL